MWFDLGERLQKLIKHSKENRLTSRPLVCKGGSIMYVCIWRVGV